MLLISVSVVCIDWLGWRCDVVSWRRVVCSEGDGEDVLIRD